MIRKPVQSSNIKSVGYDPTTKTMEVEFHNGGVFEYHNVSPEHHTAMLNSESVGSYFHNNIKNDHKTNKKK